MDGINEHPASGYINRIVALEEQKREIALAIRDVYREAKEADGLSWKSTDTLRFREQGDGGMILEQLFVCISIGEGSRTRWFSVPVVPESTP